MSTPAADALMAAVLADPADPLPRLVFADYLDDTGTPGAAAWAEYLRLRAAAAEADDAVRRDKLRLAAEAVAPRVTGSLTLPAADFLADVPRFRDLLPVERFTLRLAGFTPRTPVVIPEFCRLHRGLPLRRTPVGTVVGLIDAADSEDRRHWLEEIRDALFVRIPTDELEPAVERAFAPTALAVAVPPTVPPSSLDEHLGAATAEIMRDYLEQLVRQARERGASAIDITAYETYHWVRRVENGRSLRWHRVGTAVGRELVRTARALPTRRLRVRVRVRNSSFGEGVRISLLNPPAAAGVPVP